MSTIKTIGVIAYHHASESDTLIPWEIITGVSVYYKNQNQPGLEVKLIAMEEGPVEMQMGGKILPHGVLKDNDLFDMIYIPGGMGSGVAAQNTRLLSVIQKHKKANKVVVSNCTGLSILYSAGILGDTPVTCSPPVIEGLKQAGVNIMYPRVMWKGVPKENIWTIAGAGTINPGTIALVNHYFGDVVGREMSMWFDSRGPFGSEVYHLEGPECYLHPEAEKKITREMSSVLLPSSVANAAHRETVR